MTYETAPVEAAVADHLLRHGADALTRVHRLLNDALAEAGAVLQGCGADQAETLRAVNAFTPVLAELAAAARLLRERQCACSSEDRVKLEEQIESARLEPRPMRRLALVRKPPADGAR